MFRKNLMEFFIGLDYYLYYFTHGCTLKSHGHKSFQNVLWSHDSSHMICLLKLLYYLYYNPIMHLDVVDQIVQMCRKLFPFWGSHNMAPSSSFLVSRNFSIDSNFHPIFSLSPFHIFFSPIHTVILL